MKEPNAMQTPFIAMAPALLIPCFAAWRLARFNNQALPGKSYFIGMPTPAAGLFIASLPLTLFFNYSTLGQFLEMRIVLYVLIALVGLLMVSNFPFLKWNTGKGLKGAWPQIVIVITSIVAWPFLGFGAISVGFLAYIVLSLVYKYPEIAE